MTSKLPLPDSWPEDIDAVDSPLNVQGQAVSWSSAVVEVLRLWQKSTFGTAALVDTGTSPGQVPVLTSEGKLPPDTIPEQGTAASRDAGFAAGQVPYLDSSGDLPLSVYKSSSPASREVGTDVGDIPVFSAAGVIAGLNFPAAQLPQLLIPVARRVTRPAGYPTRWSILYQKSAEETSRFVDHVILYWKIERQSLTAASFTFPADTSLTTTYDQAFVIAFPG